MKKPASLFLLGAVLLSFSGCATAPDDPLAARRRAYEGLIKFIEPGMTRRQLYALLPPSRTPTAQPPHFSGIVGIMLYTYHAEKHPLDGNFSLFVQYRLCDWHEYASAYGATPKSFESDRRLRARKPARSSVHTTSGKPLSKHTLDDLSELEPIDPFLEATVHSPSSMPSKQNMNDELEAKPVLIDGSNRTLLIPDSSVYFDMQIPR